MTLVLVLFVSPQVDKLATFTVADEDKLALLALAVDVVAFLIPEGSSAVLAVDPCLGFDALYNGSVTVVAETSTVVATLTAVLDVAFVAVVAADEETGN